MTFDLTPMYSDEAQLYDLLEAKWEKAREQFGTTGDAETAWQTAAGKVNILGARGLEDGKPCTSSPDKWDDTLFVAWKDASGTKHVKRWLYSNEYNDTTLMCQLILGVHKYKLGHHRQTSTHIHMRDMVNDYAASGKKYRALRPHSTVTAFNDSNSGNHIEDAGERYPSTGINFHYGGDYSGGPQNWSGGCQVIYDWPKYREFIETVEDDHSIVGSIDNEIASAPSSNGTRPVIYVLVEGSFLEPDEETSSSSGGGTPAFPVDLGAGTQIDDGSVQRAFDHTEKDYAGGYYPIGTNTVWHGGLHLHLDEGTAVNAMAGGTVIAARVAPDTDNGHGHYGSRNFILVEHEDGNGKTWYSVYMHLQARDLGSDSLSWIGDDAGLKSEIAAGGIVAPGTAVDAGDQLWWSGLYGSPGYEAGILHWEVFSAEKLFPDWPEVVDSDSNFNLDSNTIMSLIDQDEGMFESDEVLTADEVNRFYQSGDGEQVRNYACKFYSEWALDDPTLEQAIEDMKIWEYETWGLKDKIQPYMWWDEIVASGLDVNLPSDRVVWHYNPISLLAEQAGVDTGAPAGGGEAEEPPAPDYNPDVLLVANRNSEGGFAAGWDTDGAPEDFWFDGEKLYEESQTYCCGFTWWTAAVTASENGLLEGKTKSDMLSFRQDWFGMVGVVPADTEERQCAVALPNLGIGATIESLDDARSGDFCQFWRTNDSGHSVVFLNWLEENGTRVGIRYRSSQGSTDGIGDTEERFSGHGGSVDPARVYLGRITGSADAVPQANDEQPASDEVVLTGSVGKDGDNHPADVEAVKQRFVDLGYDWLTVNQTCDEDLIWVIELFQGIKAGNGSVIRKDDNHHYFDGRIDKDGDTHQWLNASNAPRWMHTPLGGTGWNNWEREDNDDHDYATDWMVATLNGAGQHYEDNYRTTNPGAALIHANDFSKHKGGISDDHGSHQTGLDVDIRLPRKDGTAGGITVSDTANYDRDAMRAILEAFHAQGFVTTKNDCYLEDDVLIGENLCIAVDNHHHHLHVRLTQPTRGEAAPDVGETEPSEQPAAQPQPEPEPEEETPTDTDGGVMHTVQPGEYLSLIAQNYGVGSWEEIYDHPNNADFRALRPDPNIIEIGDQVFVPTGAAVS